MQRALLFVAVCLSLPLAAAATSLPTPPSNATVFNNIDDRGSWSYCHNPGCAGGSGKGSYWMAEHQSSPSRDGGSTEFYNSGVWANALWWQKLGANDNAHNFLWDFISRWTTTRKKQPRLWSSTPSSLFTATTT